MKLYNAYLDKLKEYDKNEIQYLYIYNILINEESLPEDI